MSELIASGKEITQSFDACALYSELEKEWSSIDKCLTETGKSTSLLKLIDTAAPLLQKQGELQSREKTFVLFQWLFSEALLELGKMRNFDLVKYLNFKILETNPSLLDFLSVKHTKEFESCGTKWSSKYIEKAVELL